MKNHVKNYFNQMSSASNKIDKNQIEKMVRILIKIRKKKGRVFFLGVGGSAGNCTHAVNDFRKICEIECYTPTDNVSELTARINDDGWKSVFSNWLMVSNLKSSDAVFIMSVGGGNYKMNVSVNLIKAMNMGWKQLIETFKEIRKMRVVGMFLLAYWFYIDGVDTIIKMAVDYGMSLKFPNESLIVALLIVQFIAFPAALIYGWMASKVGTKNGIMIGIMAYSIITFLGYFMTKVVHFYILAILIGLFQGGIQALSRSLYTRIIPPSKSAEFFGFYNMFGKFAAIVGPALMGTVTIILGNARVGILSILLLFMLGAYFLNKVDVEEGKRIVKEGF